MKLILPQVELRNKSSKKRAKVNMWFFKTGPGEYGEGDEFIGVAVPDIRKIARKHQNCTYAEVKHLLYSKIHEDRLLGLLILVIKYNQVKDLSDKYKVVKFYLKHKLQINNWDLVDVSVYKILGDYCLKTNNPNMIKKLLVSSRHWDRRMAIVSTLSYIKAKRVNVAFDFAKKLLSDQEDLMHKATGWMLREAGKVNVTGLRAFIAKYGKKMPRTMLRYAIERCSKSERKKILQATKNLS